MFPDRTLERRRKRRFPAKDGCLVTIQSDPVKPWQILDISEEGLSFRYIGGAEELKPLSQLDILTCDTTLCIERVPFKLVSDRTMVDPAPKRFQMNRCSVQFGSLTPEQTTGLTSFLRDYIASPKESDS
ncbi:MAG: hypothetical protein C4576_25470 [Desulfobacteraceae bacterium]|nr:MAG: hypothetical protein C4576_25470 [Desulfobacteraceae bacterium]